MSDRRRSVCTLVSAGLVLLCGGFLTYMSLSDSGGSESLAEQVPMLDTAKPPHDDHAPRDVVSDSGPQALAPIDDFYRVAVSGAVGHDRRRGFGSVSVSLMPGRPVKALSNIRVRLRTFHSGAGLAGDVQAADETGEVRFERVPAGPVTVTTSLGSFDTGQVCEGQTLAIRVDVPALQPVLGHVNDTSLRPVAGARIWISSFDEWVLVATSSASGTFVVDGTPPGVAFAASALGHAIGPVKRSKLNSRLNLVVGSAESVLRGRVVDWADHGVEGALVKLRFKHSSGLPTGAASFVTRTDSEGRFELRELPAGKHELSIVAVACAPFLESIVIPQFGVLEIRPQLGADSRVRGVVRCRGELVEGVVVEVAPEDGPFIGQALTDHNGRFSIIGLSSGAHQAFAYVSYRDGEVVYFENDHDRTEQGALTEHWCARSQLMLDPEHSVDWNVELLKCQ